MKQGWEIKKLGEVCDIIGGSTPKTGEPSYWDGVHYWITPAELDGSKYISSTSRTITDEGVKSAHLQLLPSGTVLLSSRAPIGKVAITTTPMYCNQGFKNLVCSNMLYNEFAYWFLYYNTEYLNSLGTGATFKEISKRVVEQIPIPIPPREEQERIVEELDCLSGVIEKKREQLCELDALAQSIFYQIFGNPITNEKGWEVKKLGEIAYIGLGFTHTPEYVEEGVAFLSVKDISRGEICWDNIKYVSQQEYDSAPKGAKPNNGDIMFCRVGTMGKPVIVDTDIPFCTFVSLGYLHILDEDILNIYVKYWMQSYAFDVQVEENVKGVAIKNLNTGWLKTFNIQHPPLALQQEFADKIEAIEKQKELIKQSITQTEELFNARMDYYFN